MIVWRTTGGQNERIIDICWWNALWGRLKGCKCRHWIGCGK
jgi:hypothetical protein